MSKPPPINLLLAVEAATRLGSFKRASEELMITPSAVSHRVRSAEALIGSPLFKRVGQGIEPLPDAKRIAASVAKSMYDINCVWSDIREKIAQRPVRVSAVSAFASNFILPDLEHFRRKHPIIRVELTSRSDTSGLERGDYDILIRYGDRPTGNVWSEHLLDLQVSAIVAPQLRSQVVQNNVLKGPLLRFSSRPNMWEFASKSLEMTLDPNCEIVTFDSMESARAAALEGIGVALLPSWVAEGLLTSGRVVSLSEAPITSDIGYWIATRAHENSLPVVAAFISWLRSQIRKSGYPG